jgi:hypothetical protein
MKPPVIIEKCNYYEHYTQFGPISFWQGWFIISVKLFGIFNLDFNADQMLISYSAFIVSSSEMGVQWDSICSVLKGSGDGILHLDLWGFWTHHLLCKNNTNFRNWICPFPWVDTVVQVGLNQLNNLCHSTTCLCALGIRCCSQEIIENIKQKLQYRLWECPWRPKIKTEKVKSTYHHQINPTVQPTNIDLEENYN